MFVPLFTEVNKAVAQRKVFKFNEIFDTMVYPAGEPHIRLKGSGDKLFDTMVLKDSGDQLRSLSPYFRPFIIASIRDWNGVMQVAIADEILKDNGIDATFVIPYFPFSRHDRKNDECDSSPIPWVLQLLKDVACVTIDPHSDVAGVLPHYEQSEVVMEFSKLGIFDSTPIIAIPDAGATKKAYSWLGDFEYVQCLKTRNPLTGELGGFQVINSEFVSGRNVVIIDDICDGGGTFIGLAEELKKAGAQNLILGVTHGLFTKGISVLLEKFLWIYTLDTSTIKNGAAVITASTEKIVLEGKYF